MTARRILIIIAGGALVLCGLTVAVTQGLFRQLTDTARINSMAQGIADFELPAGYVPDYAVDVLDYSIVAYKSADEQGHVAFLQAPPGIIPDGQVLDGYIASNRDERWTESQLLHSEQRTIRNQPATLTISERTNSEGQPYRNLNMVFEGRDGPVLLVINQPLEDWSDEMVDAFIASIH